MGFFSSDSDQAQSYQDVYQGDDQNKSSWTHEAVGGAAAFEAARIYEQRCASEGKPQTHALAKEMIAGIAGAEARVYSSKDLTTFLPACPKRFLQPTNELGLPHVRTKSDTWDYKLVGEGIAFKAAYIYGERCVSEGQPATLNLAKEMVSKIVMPEIDEVSGKYAEKKELELKLMSPSHSSFRKSAQAQAHERIYGFKDESTFVPVYSRSNPGVLRQNELGMPLMRTVKDSWDFQLVGSGIAFEAASIYEERCVGKPVTLDLAKKIISGIVATETVGAFASRASVWHMHEADWRECHFRMRVGKCVSCGDADVLHKPLQNVGYVNKEKAKARALQDVEKALMQEY
ncbi:hypothetical protein P7C70_g7626, partial [Phenoliferia sp. Uapishka_3]